jgi:hypothetical protein
MNFFSDLFRRKLSIDPALQITLSKSGKEKQLVFVKDFLKPLLKAEGYKTAGNKWWKFHESFFNFIELQNFSWNSKNSVDFCFNFTTGLTSDIKNVSKPTIHDGISHIRESYFKVKKNDYWKGANGYHIDDLTDSDKFNKQVIDDFRLLILPKFNSLTTEESIIDFYSDEFWAPRIKQSLSLGYKDASIDS